MVRTLHLLCFVVALLAIAVADCRASIIHPGWEDQARHAAFVGIVECEIAGVGTSRYRVVESWKGFAVGTPLTINRRTIEGTPTWALALCGERYLLYVNAYPVPPGWYNRHSWWLLAGAYQPDPSESSEPRYWSYSSLRIHPKDRWRSLQNLGFYGAESAFRDSVRSRFASSNSSVSQASPAAHQFETGGPTDSLAESIRTARGFELVKAMQALTASDPDGAREFLLTRSPDQDSSSRVSGFSLMNYYGWHCDRSRIGNFTRLLAAKDPVVRAGGAVFLAGEDSLVGIQALRSAISLPGFAGAWASVAMAGRGDKAAADSVMQHLTDSYSGTYQDHWWHLRSAFMALLSNSARASGLSPPPVKDIFEEYNSSSKNSRRAASRLRKWWSEVRSRIVLRDPWLLSVSKAQL